MTTIEKSDRWLPPVLTSPVAGDAEAAVVAEAIDCARQQRKLAAAQRRGARQERVDRMQAAVNKLRSAAAWTIGGAITSGAAGLAAAGLGLCRASKIGAQAGAVKKVALRASAAAGRLDAAAQTARTLSRIDPGRLAGGFLEADRRELELGAEIAAKQGDDAQQRTTDADRSESTLTGQLEKLHQARQRAERAALGG